MERDDIKQRALLAHKKLRGKIEVVSKARVKKPADLSVYYSPGVGAVSSYVAKFPEKAREYTIRRNTVAVVSDGSAVLGLGNLGPVGALPVMEGKAMLFKSFANVDAFPIVLSTQDVDEIVETVARIAHTFGGINLEDIAAPRCFEVESRLKQLLDIPVFHDDQHGTAMVVLAGLLNALRVAKKNLESVRIVIAGAGAAGNAIAELLLLGGAQDIILLDSKGILSKNRDDLNVPKQVLLAKTNPRNIAGGLDEALLDADVFIGVSKGGTVTCAQVASMAERSIVFALANPVPEIMPDEAKKAGALVVATGRSDFPNQLNNVLGFPGIFRGALDHRVRDITNEMLVVAAKKLAKLVVSPKPNMIIPSPFDKRVVPAVASAIREKKPLHS
ncbi:MAG: NADP-dependent malic enzyme [Candidatus Moraniibacteriota bacterium]|nr:MAG: NADP-dependent malic enzyme [Candidatus Moranbacteria bacterium]